LAVLATLASTTVALAANCGGSVVCQCGDTVTSDYAMTADLGPCPRVPDPTADTVGLTLKSGVSLDCQGHSITGPRDKLKNSFGVGMVAAVGGRWGGRARTSHSAVPRFWWGVFFKSAKNFTTDKNPLYENG